jgi:hypothetical protein
MRLLSAASGCTGRGIQNKGEGLEYLVIVNLISLGLDVQVRTREHAMTLTFEWWNRESARRNRWLLDAFTTSAHFKIAAL